VDPNTVPELAVQLSNSGRWGPDDERGTLNLITPADTVRAAGLIQSGRIVAASHEFTMATTAHKPRPGWHRMLFREDRDSAADAVMIEPHGYEITHLDAIGHVGYDGHSYNERPWNEVVTRDGLTFASVLPLADGIATRGVLLDIARSQGRDWLERGEEVTALDLDRAATWAHLSVGRGDALVVRVGLEAREAVTGQLDNSVRTGLGLDCLPWLYRHDVALFGGDCIERLPSGDSASAHPLHSVGLARMGLVLLDHIAVEELARVCLQEERWEFFFAVGALRIPSATASPVNPLCIF
jgi:Putative cyclase